MICYEPESTDPCVNLATEEYLLRSLPEGESCFMLWQNEPCVVLGRFQNAAEEIDRAYVEAHGVRVVRRLTGGGAVYHDLGNLNYTFIVPDDGRPLDLAVFASPIIDALSKLGVKAELSGRNDILIDGRKICGNAQHSAMSKKMHHGCIMLDTDLEAVAAALRPSDVKFESKSTKSVRSRVAAINDLAPRRISMEELKEAIKSCVEGLQPRAFSEEDLAAIKALAEEKYAADSWVYGESPDYSAGASARFSAGTVSVKLAVSGGVITGIKIYGDFFGNGDISELEAAITGLRTGSALRDGLAGIPVGNYITGLSPEELASLLEKC